MTTAPIKRTAGAFATAGMALAGLALAGAQAPAQAQDTSFKGKTVTIFITSGTGGSVDLMGRLGARHLGKHLPGNPSIIAKNKGGAGGIIGANYIWDQAPKDGTELGSSLNSIPFAPLFYGQKKSKASFDPTKFNWIASPVKFVAVSIAWHTSKIKKWQDLRENEMIVGSSGLGSSSTIDGFVMNALMDFKYKVIIGYPSGSDIDLAMIRGETEGRVTTAWAGITSRYPNWIKDKKVTLLYQMGLEKYPGVPADVPLIIEHVQDPKKKAALKLKMAAYDVGYPIYAPPGTPDKTVATLRKAYADTYADKQLLAEAKKARVDIAPLTGEQVAKIVADAYAAPEDVKELLRTAINAPQKLEKAKTVKVSTTIKDLKKKGRVVAFEAKGKDQTARVGRKTKITVAGKAAKAGDLKKGMACTVDYYGDGGQARTIACK
ncbi:MAG: tripartite tricarboxylate transporter substrate-binding protein [Alphaproteobacteria bacterium]